MVPLETVTRLLSKSEFVVLTSIIGCELLLAVVFTRPSTPVIVTGVFEVVNVSVPVFIKLEVLLFTPKISVPAELKICIP